MVKNKRDNFKCVHLLKKITIKVPSLHDNALMHTVRSKLNGLGVGEHD